MQKQLKDIQVDINKIIYYLIYNLYRYENHFNVIFESLERISVTFMENGLRHEFKFRQITFICCTNT